MGLQRCPLGSSKVFPAALETEWYKAHRSGSAEAWLPSNYGCPKVLPHVNFVPLTRCKSKAGCFFHRFNLYMMSWHFLRYGILIWFSKTRTWKTECDSPWKRRGLHRHNRCASVHNLPEGAETCHVSCRWILKWTSHLEWWILGCKFTASCNNLRLENPEMHVWALCEPKFQLKSKSLLFWKCSPTETSHPLAFTLSIASRHCTYMSKMRSLGRTWVAL